MINRNYGIDFLRILSMFMVVILHVLGQGGILENASNPANYWTAWFLEIASYCAVNCFALISGFVLCNSKVKLSRIVELWLQTAFYTITLTTIFFIIFPDTFSWFELLNAIFPITRKHYWYISAYFGLYFLIPLINSILKNIDKKTLEITFFVAFFIFSVLPTVLLSDAYVLNGGYSLIWLCLLYLLGGYIKKYNIIHKFKKSTAWILFTSMVVITFISKVSFEFLTILIFGEAKFGNLLIAYTSPTIVLAGVFLFIVCAKLTFTNKINKIISLFTPAALGVYLVHVSRPVWTNVIKDFSKSFSNYNLPIMVLLIFASAIIIYLTCSLIELARIQLFKLFKIKNCCIKIESFSVKKVDRIYNHFTKE